jgi:hypothetical protein
MRIVRVLFVAGACALVSGAQSQNASADSQKLTARELFYAVRDTAKPAETGPKAPVAIRKAPSANRPATASRPAESTQTNAIGNTQQNSTSAPLISVSDSGPLGLRYTILQRSGGQNAEVAPGTMFHSGDHISFKVEANDDGYLYIVQQGTSGTWSVLFPTADAENGDNRVHRGRSYTFPSGAAFVFAGDPGTEKLFVVLSRQPEKELESLMYSLQQHTSAPAQFAAPPKPSRVLLVSSNIHIDDNLIDRFRNDVQARDLIIEKAGDEEPAAKADGKVDQSVYVVNPSGSSASRVVADIGLTHR